MKLPDVFVEDKDHLIEKMFLDWGWGVVSSPDRADLLVFGGGSDVSPMLYGHAKMPCTHNDPERDQYCSDLFLNSKVPCVGICRGSQFLNVMCGGEMFQDVNNHGGTHDAINPETGQIYSVTSTHHQMMIPTDLAEIILEAECSDSRITERETENPLPDKDIEVVYYEEDECLCVQYHPEYVGKNHECQQLFFEMIRDYFKLEGK